MLHTVGASCSVIEKDVIDSIGPAFRRQKTAPATAEGIDCGEIDAKARGVIGEGGALSGVKEDAFAAGFWASGAGCAGTGFSSACRFSS